MPYADIDEARENSREARREKTAAAQDIAGRLESIANKRRRARAEKSFAYFAKTYFPERFDKPWSDDHFRVIALIEQAVLAGGKLEVAMPRGSGKTTLIEVACIWAILLGARSFIALIGSDKQAAVEMLDSIKAELSTNELLASDFPREVGPFALLEGEARRANGQRFEGKRTLIKWTADTIVFGTLPESKASGAILRVAGITGRVRGMKFTRPDGRVARPDLCVVDDPQTDDSARSASQTDFRENVLTKSIRGLAGPGKRIAILMPVTVIRRGDLAERFFDRRRHPEWEGVRLKALHSFPSNLKLWEEYARIYRNARERGADAKEATSFYRRNRAAMDAGAEPSWRERFEAPQEISAIQNAMNLFLFNRASFFSEHQNEPEPDIIQSAGRITAEAVLAKLNGRPRGEVPANCQWITGHVDVHDEILYFQILAIEAGFTPYTIDYGYWPEQPERYFSQENPPIGLSRVYPGLTKEGAIYAGLSELLVKRLMPRRYPREAGGEQSIDLLLVDAGYKPDEVAKVIRAAGQGNRLMPSRGFGIGPAKKPFTEYRQEPGQILGKHWRKAVIKSTGMLTLEIDTNRWKSFTRDRILQAAGGAGPWTLFGRDPRDHQLLADHLAAEVPIAVSGPYGALDQWTMPANHPDQHLFDNLVSAMCAANATPGGAKLAEWQRGKTTPNDKPASKKKAVHYL